MKKLPDTCMTKNASTEKKASSGILVYIVEELGDARLRCAQLKNYVKECVDLVEKSEHRDHFFEVAGHLIHGVPDVVMRLDSALNAAAMGLARLDYDEVKNELRPEKADELENILGDVRLRYLNRRSNDVSETNYGRKSASFDTREMLLDYLFNSIEHGGPAEAVRDFVSWGFDEAFAKELIHTWEKERPDLDLSIHSQDKAEALVDRVMHKHHISLTPPSKKAAYPSSPKDVEPLSPHVEQSVWDAGYEAASYYATKGVTHINGEDLFLNAIHKIRDPRIPHDLNESHAQFWEYLGTFLDGAKAYARSQNDFDVRSSTQEIPMNAKTAAYFLNKLATLTEKGGRVPSAALMTLVAKLEGRDKKASALAPKAASAFRGIASELLTQKNPSRLALASTLRRILADTLEMPVATQEQQQQMQQQAGAGEEFQKANPKITDEEAKVIDEMHAKHKSEFKA